MVKGAVVTVNRYPVLKVIPALVALNVILYVPTATEVDHDILPVDMSIEIPEPPPLDISYVIIEPVVVTVCN